MTKKNKNVIINGILHYIVIYTDMEIKMDNLVNIKKLRKSDLIEILISQAEEIEYLKGKLEEKNIILEESGSIAIAALRLNNIFEDAQKAADQYVESVKYQTDRKVSSEKGVK
ncbi:DNA repair protein [Streptococcus uberis]|uniref:DNA repair protein n=2 Tax=Streptococcus uberis TaxID=1349 RepID=UPI002DDBAED9|nr:DNA repair protein [Streptococcus uberis]